MKKVLVLGGNGFIGKNLCCKLKESNYDVYSFDLKSPEHKETGITYIEGDFFDDFVLKNVIDGMDVIYHAICTMNPGNSNSKYIVGYERDLIQTIKLCDFLKDKDTRMIFLSSGGTVYGQQEKMPINETCIPMPINHYGNLKLCIENTLRVFRYQQKANFLIARISNPYGPGQDYTKGVGFIDAVMKRSIHNEDIEVWGDGEIIRDYIYIDDVCRSLCSLIDYKGEYDVINISSGIGVSQNEILNIMKVYNANIKIKYMDKRSVDVEKIILDNSRMKQINEYNLVSIEDGIKKYYKMFV